MNVNEAAKLLDKLSPDWHNKIHFESLNMNNCGDCILGQIFGTFDKGIDIIYHDDIERFYHKYRNLMDEPFGYETKIDLWFNEVALRKGETEKI